MSCRESRLNAKNKGAGHYIGLVVLILVQLLYIFMLRYGVKLRKNSIQSTVDFFEQNPQYRQYHSNNDISKNISIIGNYIFLINGAKIIDLNKSSNFEFYTSRYHHQLFQTNYSLTFDNDGKRESVFLGPLSSVGLEKLKNYISNYEKLKV